ncbi:MAG: aminotransferase class V-fold PLP-dependent enzyme [Peptostreptococcus sp.]|uniref:aminotransferase class V-fold PLP-dependent enzyme n=1 Tax=Peptostreptococcus sp. TaxID=1262 RepID=UPI002FCB13A6
MIYLDNAATSKTKPDEVIQAVIDAMQSAGNASRGASNESLSSDRIVFQTRKKISELFNVSNPRQVVFTKNSTEAINVALQGIIEEGDHVITSCMEHNSVLRPLNYLKRDKKVEVDYIHIDENGDLKYEEIKGLIKLNTKVLVLNHASNVTGNINNLRHIGDICRAKNIIFIVDVSQSAGSFEIDMIRDNIDVLCFTGHKSLLGPQGTGGLCVRDNIYIEPLMSGGTGVHTYDSYQPDRMPTRLESGTLNAHGIAGLGAGIDYINSKGMDKLTEKATIFSKTFFDGVKSIDNIKLYGNYDTQYRAPIVSLNIADMDSSELSAILSDKYNISTRPGAHCAPLLHESMKTVDQGMVRFSFSHQNTMEEVEFAIKAIREVAEEENSTTI